MDTPDIVVLIFIGGLIVLVANFIYVFDTTQYCKHHTGNSTNTNYYNCLEDKGLGHLTPKPFSSIFHGEP